MAEQPVQEGPEAAAGGEFEREPVPERSQLGFGSFVGMYAGEHCAGTELMIGPLFVLAGVSAFDVVVGLLVGNALAVLSWMFICAPIATRARLTLYYQLEKICGRHLVTLYNLTNGVMFCFLAGAMITVSATAIAAWLRLPMPSLDAMYPDPNNWGFVAASIVVGVLIALVAAGGYNVVARFANVASPWMVLVFLAFGLIALRQFIDTTGMTIRSASDLWRLADTAIWKGGDAAPGYVKFTFWHVMFFAWFCNMAMHIGMADLSVFRFAKKPWYAVASAAGMYVGHYMAWLAASLLYAYKLHEFLHRHGTETVGQFLDQSEAGAASLPTVAPGELAFEACGIAGLICVIVAGWTTANPTIYRAGLAFQAIFPKASRFWVTFITGLLATAIGVFPAIAMKLLGFVALYGLLLMPMGAVIFIDFWLMRRLGLKSNYAETNGINFNVAAAVAWILTVVSCLVSLQFLPEGSLYFISLPGWFMAALLYIIISKMYQEERPIRVSEQVYRGSEEAAS